MQEFLIYLSIGLGIFFWLFGIRVQKWHVIAVGATFFLFLSLGLFNSGWEHYEGDATITEVSATVTDVKLTPTTHYAIWSGNPNERVLYFFSTILLILSLILYFASYDTYRFVKLASSSYDEQEE